MLTCLKDLNLDPITPPPTPTQPLTASGTQKPSGSLTPSNSSKKLSFNSPTLLQLKNNFTLGYPKAQMSLQATSLFMEEILKQDFYTTLYTFAQNGKHSGLQEYFKMTYAKFPIQVFASSLFYKYDPEALEVQKVSPGCINNRHFFGRDFCERKLIFALRANTFFSTWVKGHPITHRVFHEFKKYHVELPECIASPYTQKSFWEVQDEVQLTEWAESWYTQIATITTQWLFLRQVISDHQEPQPHFFPQPTILEPSYEVLYIGQTPISIQTNDGYPVYNYWNNEDNYISARQVIHAFIPYCTAEVIHRFLYKGLNALPGYIALANDSPSYMNRVMERVLEATSQDTPLHSPRSSTSSPSLKRSKKLTFPTSKVWLDDESSIPLENLTKETKEEGQMEGNSGDKADLEDDNSIYQPPDDGFSDLWAEWIIEKIQDSWKKKLKAKKKESPSGYSSDAEYGSGSLEEELDELDEEDYGGDVPHGFFNTATGEITWPPNKIEGKGDWYSSDPAGPSKWNTRDLDIDLSDVKQGEGITLIHSDGDDTEEVDTPVEDPDPTLLPHQIRRLRLEASIMGQSEENAEASSSLGLILE